jgi:arginine decarboxylase
MVINISSGTGEASTLLSSFDAALNNAGVYNYNLIPLSSVIPPRTQIKIIDRYESPEEEYGHKLFCVIAHERSNEIGKFIAAAVGWYQVEDGRGVFVEHHIIGETREAVESEINQRIHNSLRDLCDFRKYEFISERIGSKIEISEVTENPACVLVIAVYESEGWKA